MCSERSRTRLAVGSYARSASCGRAPRSVCRTWPTTFAAWGRWNGSPRHEGVGIVGLQLQPKQWAKKEAVKTANQIESRTQPELVLNQASKSTIVRGAHW